MLPIYPILYLLKDLCSGTILRGVLAFGRQKSGHAGLARIGC